MKTEILSQQSKLRKLLFVRPYDLIKIENEAIKLCDMTIDLFENGEDLKEKFEDFYYAKELEHLKNGTEFTTSEIFDYFKPYLK